MYACGVFMLAYDTCTVLDEAEGVEGERETEGEGEGAEREGERERERERDYTYIVLDEAEGVVMKER